MSTREAFEKWFDTEFDPKFELFAEDKALHWLTWQAATEQGEPSGVWQFYQNGEWHVGSNTHNHRENTEGAGIPTRDLYTHPPKPTGGGVPDGLERDPQDHLVRKCYVDGWNDYRAALLATQQPPEQE